MALVFWRRNKINQFENEKQMRTQNVVSHSRLQSHSLPRIFYPAIVAATVAFGAVTVARAQNLIKIDGSSTVFPVTEAVAEEFQKEKKGKVRVTVGISGTGGGFKKFARGETDVQDASRPILTEE